MIRQGSKSFCANMKPIAAQKGVVTMLWTGLIPFIYGLQADPLITEQQIQKWAQTYAPIVIHDSRETSPLSSVEQQIKLNPVLQGTCADGSRQKLTLH